MIIKNIESYIDHTMLKANATKEEIIDLCNEAEKYRFASVCVNSFRVIDCYELLKDSKINICAVVGFPLGAMSTKAKAFEASGAIADGANEIDMVINIGWLKDKDYKKVANDIDKVKKACGEHILKVIIETCLLTDEEKIIACKIAKEQNADFVKTSTGFSTEGAKVNDIALMRKIVGNKLGVKASGGIHSYGEAVAMIEAGATRIGASAGIKIIEQSKEAR